MVMVMATFGGWVKISIIGEVKGKGKDEDEDEDGGKRKGSYEPAL